MQGLRRLRARRRRRPGLGDVHPARQLDGRPDRHPPRRATTRTGSTGWSWCRRPCRLAHPWASSGRAARRSTGCCRSRSRPSPPLALGVVGLAGPGLDARRNRALLKLIFPDPDRVDRAVLDLMAADFAEDIEGVDRRRALLAAICSISPMWTDPRRTWRAVRKIQAPTLLLGGTQDALVPAKVLRAVLAAAPRLGGPRPRRPAARADARGPGDLPQDLRRLGCRRGRGVGGRALGDVQGHRDSAFRSTDWSCLPSARAPTSGINAPTTLPLTELGTRFNFTCTSVPPSAATAGSASRCPAPTGSTPASRS